jgi:hypothetical protein
MGMDTENVQHTALLKESMLGVVNPNDFIEYCRNKKNGIEYMNRLEKLDTLATQYKRTVNNIPTGLLQSFSKNVSNKFKVAIQTLRDNEEFLTDNLNRLKVDGNSYFTEKEILLLNEVGKLNRLINLYELGTLNEALYSKSVEKTLLKNMDNALPKGANDVMKLVQKVTV